MTRATVHSMVANTLQSRALMANALCAVAEEQAHAGSLMGATETVRSVRLLLSDIDLLLSGDTSYIPCGTLRETSDLLAGLDDRIRAVERATGSGTIH